MDKIFTEANKVSKIEWKKFENIGDFVQGTIRNIEKTDARTDDTGHKWEGQRVFLVQLEDGTRLNVGLKRTADHLNRTNKARIGDYFKVRLANFKKNQGKLPSKVYDIWVIPGPEGDGQRTAEDMEV